MIVFVLLQTHGLLRGGLRVNMAMAEPLMMSTPGTGRGGASSHPVPSVEVDYASTSPHQ